MKNGIHPDYGFVVFHDTSCDEKFLMKSTATSGNTVEWEDGNTYPLITTDTSSASHPFYTGKERIVTAEGRVAKFNRRFKRT
ncbi:MAG: large subunit ribosomal protein L31 [Gammaproteobacteria bacterium]|jgi:large subunit ribosomal protein L31